MDEITRQELLDELCPRLRPTVQRMMDCPCGCEALDFFRYRPRGVARVRRYCASSSPVGSAGKRRPDAFDGDWDHGSP